MTIIAWVGALMVGGWVAAYIAYTLGGFASLQGPLLHFRSTGIALGIALLLGSAAFTIVSARPIEPLLAPLGLAFLFGGYAWQRQWLSPRYAPLLAPAALRLEPDALVAVLEGGDAVPLSWLARLRTVRVGEQLVVHCALARSLSAFEAPAGPVAAVLPHSTGFILGGGGRRWDGVDGRALDAGTPLHRRPIGLATYADWRDAFPEADLHGPFRAPPTPPPSASALVRLPHARSVPDPMGWGLVERDAWRSTVINGCTDPSGSGDRYYLSRWAAHRRRDEGLLKSIQTIGK